MTNGVHDRTDVEHGHQDDDNRADDHRDRPQGANLEQVPSLHLERGGRSWVGWLSRRFALPAEIVALSCVAVVPGQRQGSFLNTGPAERDPALRCVTSEAGAWPSALA